MSSQMSKAMISAPSSANLTACERPCPRAAPEMNATFPSSFPILDPPLHSGDAPVCAATILVCQYTGQCALGPRRLVRPRGPEIQGGRRECSRTEARVCWRIPDTSVLVIDFHELGATSVAMVGTGDDATGTKGRP